MDDGSKGVEMRRSVRPGLLEVDLDQGVLIINYSMTARVVDDGEVVEDTKELCKRIKVGAISSSTDIEELADRIIESQKLLTDSKFERVCELLLELQQHKSSYGRRGGKSKKKKHKKKHKSSRKKKEKPAAGPVASEKAKAESAKPEVQADIDKLDQYTMAMYEGIQQKLEAAKCIRHLTLEPANLELMYNDVTLQNVLARELKDNYQKSMDLNIVLCQIYAGFAQFAQMQELLLKKQIGSLVLLIGRMELSRYKKRNDNLQLLKKRAEKSKDKDEVAAYKGFSQKFMPWLKKHEMLCQICFTILLHFAADRRTESKMVAKDIVKLLVSVVVRDKVRNPHLLVACLKFLKRLSIVKENMDIMISTDMPLSLLRYVGMASGGPLKQDICMKVLRLIYNLSFSVLCRRKLAGTDLAAKLVKILNIKKFRGVSIQLLYHLSMVDGSPAIKALSSDEAVVRVLELVVCFPKPKLPKELAGLTVNMTHVPDIASQFAAALDAQGLELLIKRLIEHRDALLFKVIRNIASWTYHVQEHLRNDEDYDQMGLWASFASQLVTVTADAMGDPDPNGMGVGVHDTAMLVEGLGTLALLTPDDLEEDITWYELLKDPSLLQIVEELMQLSQSKNLDVLYVCLAFVANLALDQHIGEALAQTGIPLLCVKHLQMAKDKGLFVQTMFTTFRIIRLPEVQAVLLFPDDHFYGDDSGGGESKFSGGGESKFSGARRDTKRKPRHNPLDLVDIIAAALTDTNLATVQMANELLDLIAECDILDGDGSLNTAIKSARFQLFNKAWVGVVRDEDSSVTAYEEEGTLIVDGDDESRESPYDDVMFDHPNVASAFDLDMDVSMDASDLGGDSMELVAYD